MATTSLAKYINLRRKEYLMKQLSFLTQILYTASR